MPSSDDLLKRIHDKLQQAIRQAVALRKENEKLKHDLQQCRQEAKQKDELMQILELRIDVLKAARLDMPAEDRKSLEKKINQYIKEVDKCLSLLND